MEALSPFHTISQARLFDKTPSPMAYYPKMTLVRKRPRTSVCLGRFDQWTATPNPGPGSHKVSLTATRKNNQGTAARFEQYAERLPPESGGEAPPSSKYNVSTALDHCSGFKRPMSSAFGRSRSARLPFATVNGDPHAHTEGRFGRYYTLNFGATKAHHGTALFSAQCRGTDIDFSASPGPAAYIPSLQTVKPHLRGGSWTKSVRMPTKKLPYADVIKEEVKSMDGSAVRFPSRSGSRGSSRQGNRQGSRPGSKEGQRAIHREQGPDTGLIRETTDDLLSVTGGDGNELAEPRPC